MHLQENNCLIFDFDVAQYPLHHVTNTPAKFEVATSYDLGGDTIDLLRLELISHVK